MISQRCLYMYNNVRKRPTADLKCNMVFRLVVGFDLLQCIAEKCVQKTSAEVSNCLHGTQIIE